MGVSWTIFIFFEFSLENINLAHNDNMNYNIFDISAECWQK